MRGGCINGSMETIAVWNLSSATNSQHKSLEYPPQRTCVSDFVSESNSDFVVKLFPIFIFESSSGFDCEFSYFHQFPFFSNFVPGIRFRFRFRFRFRLSVGWSVWSVEGEGGIYFKAHTSSEESMWVGGCINDCIEAIT